MAMKKSLCLLVTLFLAGIVARSTEARVAAIIYGTIPCTRPNVANMRVNIGGRNDGLITGISSRTNNEGQFMATLNMTSSGMMDSMMSGDDGGMGSGAGGIGSTKVVVTTPPVECNVSLPAIGTLEAPVVPVGARTLGATPVDNIFREILNQSQTPSGIVDAALDEVTRLMVNNTSMDILREVTDSLPTGVSYGGDTLDAYVVFGVRPFSYSPGSR